jgi:hypothetical protein
VGRLKDCQQCRRALDTNSPSWLEGCEWSNELRCWHWWWSGSRPLPNACTLEANFCWGTLFDFLKRCSKQLLFLLHAALSVLRSVFLHFLFDLLHPLDGIRSRDAETALEVQSSS